MAHALAMRATSLAASAALLGLAVLIALSATYVVQQIDWPDGGAVVTSVPEPPPPAPDEPIRDSTPPTRDVIETPVETTPLAPISSTADVGDRLAPFTPQETTATITNPHWLQRPRDLARYYPRRALAREVEGAVTLDCLVSTRGRLNCSIASETPTGWGFGEAALRIAADHRMAPAMRGGAPTEGRYRMHVPFELH